MPAEDVARVLAEFAGDVDEKARFPVESMQAIRESGLMGLLVPREYGGLGGDLDDLAETAVTLAGGCLSTAMIWAMHCQQVDTLVRFGSASLHERLLPRIAAGTVYVASVTSEKGKGGHLLTASAPLVATDAGVLVERDAPMVTGGSHADGFLITMRAAPDAPAHAVSLVYADREQLDTHCTGEWAALGMRGTDTVAMRLRGTVPADQVIGEFRPAAIDSFIPCGHIGWAACWLGAARGALSGFVSVLRSPARPSTLDLASPLVAAQLARVRIQLELVSGYLHRVVLEVRRLRGTGGLEAPAAQIHLNTLKVAASELTLQAVQGLIELGGVGLGYLKRSPVPLERHLRDLQSASLNYGNDRLLTATGKLVLVDRAVELG